MIKPIVTRYNPIINLETIVHHKLQSSRIYKKNKEIIEEDKFEEVIYDSDEEDYDDEVDMEELYADDGDSSLIMPGGQKAKTTTNE
jgi:hypothetical protein